MKLRQIAPLGVILCAASAFGAAPPNSLTGQLFVDPSFSGGTGANDQTTNQIAGPLNLFGTATGGFNTTANGETHVDYGTIKLFTSGFGSASVVARGIYRDSVTITSPGITTGTPGTLTYSIYVNGLLMSDGGDSDAGYQLIADLDGGASDISKSGTLFSPHLGGAFQGDPFGTYSATINFQYGFALSLYVEVDASVSLGYSDTNHPGSATTNMLSSSYWGGITNVQANGSPVASFTANSASGANLAPSQVPVPEPQTLGLLSAAGLLLLKRRPRVS